MSNETPNSSECPGMVPVVVTRLGEGVAAIDYYKKALNATVKERYEKDGLVMHCYMESSYGFSFGVEDYVKSKHPCEPGKEGAQRGAGIYMYHLLKAPLQCDKPFTTMKEAGATVVFEPYDAFYGHRVGAVVDKYGVAWTFANAHDKKTGMPPDDYFD